MLLPSAFSCSDALQPSVPRLQQSALLVSPPASPPQVYSQNVIGNLINSCRNLQSFITMPIPMEQSPPITPTANAPPQLPTPPMAHAPSPIKLRLRSGRKSGATSSSVLGSVSAAPRKKIVKRAPPRGLNKRRRSDDDDDDDDDMGRHDEDVESDIDLNDGDEAVTTDRFTSDGTLPRPSTPKRSRIAPENVPLGLNRSDFHSLHPNGLADDTQIQGTEIEVEADKANWSLEEDRMLLELVLAKLNLTDQEWEECAQTLRKDHGNLSRRWNTLMENNAVKVRKGDCRRAKLPIRGKLHGTWS